MRWQRRRADLLRARDYTCCECGEPLTTGRMDLQVHHVIYLTGMDPWDYPDELMVVVCDRHHKIRAALEKVIYIEVGRHLATRNIHELRYQPAYAFFVEQSTYSHLPGYMQDIIAYYRDLD